jgi:transposase
LNSSEGAGLDNARRRYLSNGYHTASQSSSRVYPAGVDTCLCRGVSARTAAQTIGVNRHTATLFYHKLRELIAVKLEEEAPFSKGDVEVDESYFGGVRKGKRGRGAAGKVVVFGLLKRGGKVYTTMIDDTRSQTLVGIIRKRVRPDSVVYTDAYRSYDNLDVSEFHHRRINHGQAFVAQGNHINGIENFWSQAKRILRRYNGIPKAHFHLFLKECEWRFNYRPASQLIRLLNEWNEL